MREDNIQMAKNQKTTPISVLTVLGHLQDEIKELRWEKLADDGVRVLIAKEEVLELIQQWKEYCLNPDQTVLATEEV